MAKTSQVLRDQRRKQLILKHAAKRAALRKRLKDTDFERGFIRAEVIAYDDFIKFKGEQGAKDAGKWRLEGKEYIVQDGDVIHFRFDV